MIDQNSLNSVEKNIRVDIYCKVLMGPNILVILISRIFCRIILICPCLSQVRSGQTLTPTPKWDLSYTLKLVSIHEKVVYIIMMDHRMIKDDSG